MAAHVAASGSLNSGNVTRSAITRPTRTPKSPATMSAAGVRRNSRSTEFMAVAVPRPRTPPITYPTADPRMIPRTMRAVPAFPCLAMA
jgi:hypothetical protein